MRATPTGQEREQILHYFLSGHGVNHVIFLMDYKFDGDDVNGVLREELSRRLTQLDLD